jgi:hypothetical protein
MDSLLLCVLGQFIPFAIPFKLIDGQDPQVQDPVSGVTKDGEGIWMNLHAMLLEDWTARAGTYMWTGDQLKAKDALKRRTTLIQDMLLGRNRLLHARHVWPSIAFIRGMLELKDGEKMRKRRQAKMLWKRRILTTAAEWEMGRSEWSAEYDSLLKRQSQY